jgi:molybdate/tungstate transport system substrate-binding protein
VPFQQIAKAFEADYPGTSVLLESAGSVASARKISDLKKPCDIMASSDYKVIEEILIPEYTGWHIPFASNEMVIAFNEQSTGGAEINSNNWPAVLGRQDVFFGRADPNADPCGYRTVMTFQLAEDYYNMPGLEQELSSRDNKYIRPKEVDLLALLEINEIDYIFIYKSVAVQHHLKFLELPEEINLENPTLDELYRNAVVRINSDQPGQTIEMKGESMIYAATIPDSSPNRKAAEAFMEFLLEKDKGMKIMEQCGQRSVVPSSNRYFTKLPPSLKRFSKEFTN